MTDAASHLAERAANSYLNSGQPLSPCPKVPPAKPPRLQGSLSPQQVAATRLQSRRKLVSDTDPFFLESPDLATMGVRRCSVCHLYIEGAPSSDLVHIGNFGPSCTAKHHPNPCDFPGKDGPCTHHEDVSNLVSGDDLTSTQLLARDKIRKVELDRMAAEIVSLRKHQVDMDQMSAEMIEMKQLMMSLRPPAQLGSSLATSTSQVASSEPIQVTSSASISNPPTPDLNLQDVVAQHIQNNTAPPATTQPRGAYAGPNMPDLRKDDTLNMITQQVLAALEQRIPQIREHFSSPGNAGQPPNLGSTPHTVSAASFSTATSVTSSLSSRPTASSLLSGQGSFHPAYQALLSGLQGPALQGGAHAGDVLQPAHQPHTEDFMDAAQIMQLCTVSNRRQLRPHEFVRMGRFSYANKITDKNITVPLFVMGYLQYVVAMLKGVAPQQSGTEVLDRLSNLMTIMEITANNSTLDDFKSPGWSIGLEYAGRIFHDIEYGRVKWEDLSEGLQAHTFLYAKDTVEMQQRKESRGSDSARGKGGSRGAKGGGRGGRGGDRSDSNLGGVKVCESYNVFRTGTGCAYEYNNQRKCGYEHFCSVCFEKSGSKEGHKAYYCKSDNSSTVSGSGNEASKPPVTSG